MITKHLLKSSEVLGTEVRLQLSTVHHRGESHYTPGTKTLTNAGKDRDQFAVTIGCKTGGTGEGVSYQGSHGQTVRVGRSAINRRVKYPESR